MNRLSKFFATVTFSLASITGVASVAHAGDYSPYAEIFIGGNFIPGIAGTDTAVGSGNLHASIGDLGGVAIGSRFAPHWRAELELSRAFNGIDNFTFNNGGVNHYPGGSINQTYALANVWYDFSSHGNFTPYVGGGLGAGWADGYLKMGGFGGSITATSSTALAFQLGMGVNVNLTDRMSLDLSYRLRGMTALNAAVTQSGGGGPYTLDQNTIVSNTVQAGLIFKF